MNTKKLMYVFSTAPYSNSAGQEALDAAMIGAAFEQDISVVFVHDGVFQIKRDQQAIGLSKQYTKAFAALEDFGIERIYVDDLSLQARGLIVEDLMIEVESLDADALRMLIRQQDRVFTF